jgi:cyanate permease
MGSQSVSWRSYGLVVSGTMIYTVLMFSWFSLPAYLPTIIEDMGLSGTEAGLLAGAVPLTYVPLALFSGLAIDRIGPGRSLGIALGCIGAAQLLRGLAPGFTSLLGATLILGVGATLVTFGLPKLVSVLFPPGSTGFPSSVYLVGASAGTAVAFSLGRPVLGPALGGWRDLFFWTGIVSFGYAVVWLIIARTSRLGTSELTDTAENIPMLQDVRTVLSHRKLRLVVVIGIAYLLIIHGLQAWLPTILEARGLSAGRAGQMTTLLVGANVIGILTVPGLADRFSAQRAAIVGVSTIASLGVVAIIAGGLTPLVVVGTVAAGVGVGGISPLIRAIPTALDGIGSRLTGTALGLVFAIGQAGGFSGPLLIGFFRDMTGSFTPGLAILVMSGLTAVAAGSRLDTDT